MLVLSRKKGQSLMIGQNIELTIIDIQGDQVRIGIRAPKDVSIHRKEVFVEIRDENIAAANSNPHPIDIGSVIRDVSGKSLKRQDGETI